MIADSTGQLTFLITHLSAVHDTRQFRRSPQSKISLTTTTSSLITSYDSPAMSQNFMTGDPLSLDRIRSVLTRLEDTIIFCLIERAQFAHNPRIYQRGVFKELQEAGFSGSWLEWFLKEIESFHGMSPLLSTGAYSSDQVIFLAKARRYTR